MGRAAAIFALLLLSHPVAASAHPPESERIEILSQRIEARPGDQGPYLARGSAYSHDGQYERALADLRKAEQLGDPVVVAYELGVLHHRMGRLDVARAHLDRFLERFPKHPPALEQRARLLAELGETEAAVASFEKLFSVTSRPNPGLYVSAAKLLAAQGDSGSPSPTDPWCCWGRTRLESESSTPPNPPLPVHAEARQRRRVLDANSVAGQCVLW